MVKEERSDVFSLSPPGVSREARGFGKSLYRKLVSNDAENASFQTRWETLPAFQRSHM